MSVLEEQYESESALVLFSCTECDHVSLSLGSLHAHAESHRGIHGLQFPWRYGDFDRLMEFTEIVRLQEVEEIPLEEVDGL
ncbi:hypothetical protein DVK02_14925 [Halobellus sp. Atlit-31R]|nr:hypothetical protein DVK02_14925 [Halobellus sp. Atlit-31R]